jgi:N-dimethylarginine dimethylaminohydrolase
MTTITAGTSLRWGMRDETATLRDVLLGPPDHFRWLPTSSISKATLVSDAKFDHELALRQHAEMVSAFAQANVNVHMLDADLALPYQVFARDSSVMTPMGALICQMAQWWRRGEYAATITFYQRHDVPIWRMVTAGSLEGGDVNMVEEGALLLGYSGQRTQQQAAEQLGDWMQAEGIEVLLEPIAEHYVHIDLLVCMIAPKLAVVCVEATSDRVLEWLRGRGIEIVPVTYRDTMLLRGNVLALGEDRVLSTAASTELNSRLRAMGLTVYDPDISMFTLGGGGIHCLCQPLLRER